MKPICPLLALAFASVLSGAQAADYAATVRSSQSTRAIVRLATQGLGYSVLHQNPNPVPAPNRVHVTCTIDESFATTFCPTQAYEAHCPNARIICR
jgi:hypothetical protein